ncbi:EpsG family protein [Paenibacillus sp. LHD-117]|uniref:EpsG family protein n=1 Tax=Paenibacillus sp. LHD-117 TaxID=3071412 RepID=UPI0027E1D9BF|nr:EpsG family protein [Paenibacillus sp. LHD-117]MDQ6423270.1 EpsG family protein [Paenibacillus sp. LHD-117]
MEMIWFALLVVFFNAFMARYFSTATVSGPLGIQPNRIYIMMGAVCLIVVAGLRNNIGDTFLYMHSYRVTDYTWMSVLQGDDIAFNIFQMMLKQMTEDPQLMIFLTAFATNALIFVVFYQYARQIELSLYAYITTGAFIVSMNGIRQFLAAAMVFAATKALLEGKWKSFFAVVVFASFFHQSALIMLPIYFLVRRKAWTLTSMLMLSMAILVVVGFNYFSTALFAVIENTQYSEYQSFQEGGANVLRVIVYIVPVLIAFLGREKLARIFPQSDIIVNLSLVGAVIMIISTQNWIFARLGIYFTLYQLILLGWIVKLFREKDQRFVYIGLICCYFLYFFYENVIILDIRYSSDYLKWPF